jgi:hypothetical protein
MKHLYSMAAIAAVTTTLMLYQPVADAAVPTQHSKEKIEQVVKAAERVQMNAALPMPLDKVKSNLGKYLTRSFATRFMAERMVQLIYGKDKGDWFVPGSDDMYLYIPDFTWNQNTTINKASEQEITVSQRFTGDEGPWTGDPCIETVVLKKENGVWKVQDIRYKTAK